MHSPSHPLSAPFNRRCPVEVAKESAMSWYFCHMHVPRKKLRLPEWYVLAWMVERALNAVVRDGKTIYIGRHMPPSFRYLTRIDKNQCPLPNSC